MKLVIGFDDTEDALVKTAMGKALGLQDASEPDKETKAITYTPRDATEDEITTFMFLTVQNLVKDQQITVVRKVAEDSVVAIKRPAKVEEEQIERVERVGKK